MSLTTTTQSTSVSFSALRVPCENRTSNSSATLSSCVSMEPCACPEESMFTALSHADATFRKMEGYLRSRQLCDVVLVAGERRIPAHR